MDAIPSSAPSSNSSSASASGERFESLTVAGYNPAWLWIPIDDGKKHPLAVITHGAGDRPEPDCQEWARILRHSAFVLCTRGRALNAQIPEAQRGYFYDGHHELGKEIDRAVESLKARFGDRVDTTNPFFKGYSQGATMGSLWLHERSASSLQFSRLLLVEGGSGEWTISQAEKARGLGLTRVLIVCGQTSCNDKAQKTVSYMKHAGIDAKLEYVPGAGHAVGGALSQRVNSNLRWLFQGDDRWSLDTP